VKFKLDENFGTRTQNVFQAAGFDTHTVEFTEKSRGLRGFAWIFLVNLCDLRASAVFSVKL